MFKQISGAVGVIAISLSLIGCGQSDTTGNVETADGSTPSAVDALYVVSEEPEGALPVGDARSSIKDKEEIVLEGRIGGSAKPFVDGIAAFTIVDMKVPYCSEDEGCPTPWDYCCQQNAVKENIATVKMVDAEGKPVMKDARDLLGVKELNTVIIKGIASRDDEGNLSVQADEVFVKE